MVSDTITLTAFLCIFIGLLIGYILVDKMGQKKTPAKRTIKPKKQGDYSKLIVSLVIVLNVLFTSAILFVFLRTGNEPGILVGCWFAFTTGELWLLASIRKKKVTKERSVDDGFSD